MDAATKELVRRRAGDACEYCGLAQEDVPFAVFHVEHVIPKQHGGTDDPSNLALACHHCNYHKGPNLAGIDPESREIVPLFHPRADPWHEHFEARGSVLLGRTPTGRATVRVLAMNTVDRIELRAALLGEDESP
ncbi:MAG TPA: HNH endonuclease [Isosphaeraceae bacterium]